MSKTILENLEDEDIVSNEIVEKLVIEIAEFFTNTKAEVIELSALTSGLMHNPKLETVLEYLGFTIEYLNDPDNVIRIRRNND